jgi:ectoine hydroxylase-related dioxygenase (phytanoyl-CoA dioxygenase family)
VQVDHTPASGIADSFFDDGFVLVPQVFAPAELQDLAEHVFHLRQPPAAERAKYGLDGYELLGRGSLDELTPRELVKIERLLRLHIFDSRTRQLMLDRRLIDLMRHLWPGDPLGVSALYYPKPPGARGFALHSDTGYLPTEPPELAGAFIAVDDADEENGELRVVRGSHRFTDVERRAIPTHEFIFPEEFIQPAGTELVLVPMKAGDVLLFHGNSLHASLPNRTTDRWRRAFICHYISAAVHSVSEELNPAYRTTGEEVPAPGHATVGRPSR